MEKSRIAALVDGISAVAMTLLVLDLKLPEGVKFNNDPEVWRQLLESVGGIAVLNKFTLRSQPSSDSSRHLWNQPLDDFVELSAAIKLPGAPS
jgi:transmembrane protein TMEM174 (potassium channel)